MQIVYLCLMIYLIQVASCEESEEYYYYDHFDEDVDFYFHQLLKKCKHDNLSNRLRFVCDNAIFVIDKTKGQACRYMASFESAIKLDLLYSSMYICGVSLENKGLTSLPNLGKYERLVSINLRSNHLGLDPNASKDTGFFYLSDKLKNLTLSNNQYSFVPAYLKNLVNLEYLDLGNNKLTLLNWFQFENLINLRQLILNGNLFDKLIFPNRWRLFFLRKLDLSDQKIENKSLRVVIQPLFDFNRTIVVNLTGNCLSLNICRQENETIRETSNRLYKLQCIINNELLLQKNFSLFQHALNSTGLGYFYSENNSSLVSKKIPRFCQPELKYKCNEAETELVNRTKQTTIKYTSLETKKTTTSGYLINQTIFDEKSPKNSSDTNETKQEIGRISYYFHDNFDVFNEFEKSKSQDVNFDDFFHMIFPQLPINYKVLISSKKETYLSEVVDDSLRARKIFDHVKSKVKILYENLQKADSILKEVSLNTYF
jgi:hypothetical protein